MSEDARGAGGAASEARSAADADEHEPILFDAPDYAFIHVAAGLPPRRRYDAAQARERR